VILLPEIDAASLGALLAAYEHATFVAAWCSASTLSIQFGVEYGKVLATSIEAYLGGKDDPTIDPATRALVQRIRQPR
jgi:glucose-6-phosphate isomerase